MRKAFGLTVVITKWTCENLVLASGTRKTLVLASGTRKTWIYIQYAIKGFPQRRIPPGFVFTPLVHGTPCSQSDIPGKKKKKKKKNQEEKVDFLHLFLRAFKSVTLLFKESLPFFGYKPYPWGGGFKAQRWFLHHATHTLV